MGGTYCKWLLGLLLVSACSTAHNKASTTLLPERKINLDAAVSENSIVFLTYEVTLKDSAADTYSFTLLNTSVVHGQLKNNLQSVLPPFDPTFLYVQFNENEVNQFLKVHDPLKLQLEFPGETNGLEKKIFLKSKGELSIRFSYQKKLKTLSIFKVQPNTRQIQKVYHATL